MSEQNAVPDSFRWIDELGTAGFSDELVDTCRDYLMLVANHRLDDRLKSKVGASDLVQETFLHAQKHQDQFRGESQPEFVAWLKQILLNHLIDETRKYRQTSKRQVSRERPLDMRDDSRGVTIDLADSLRSPRAAAIANEEAAALNLAMQRLPDDYRLVITLRNWERLSFADVGERMNRSPEAVRKLWSRAIERLQRELEKIDAET